MDDTLINKLEKLYEKVDTLEKSIHDHNTPIMIHLNVKDLHLQELNLEELAFHLDKLDIKELSGMLNLGNTFSPTVHKKAGHKRSSSQHSPSREKGKDNSLEDIQIFINGKRVPYTID